MTDTTVIEKPRMRWLDTLFNPSGTSTKIEFTRAWTLLFFLQLAVVILPWFAAFVMGLAGGDGQAIGRFGLYMSPIIFVTTTVLSYVIHTRRLRDAGKSTLFALLILVPLLLGLANFGSSVMQKASEYATLYEDRQEYLDDPIAYREKKAEERQKKIEEAEAERKKAEEEAAKTKTEDDQKEEKELPACPGAEEGPGQGQVGQRGPGPGGFGGGPSAENPLPDQVAFILRPNLQSIQMAIIPLSAILAIWSLVWVARAPVEQRYQHPSQGFARLYFGYAGRIGQKQFWLGWLGLVAMVGAGVVVSSILGAIFPPASAIIMGLVGIAAIWMINALAYKRIHDIGFSGLRAFIPLAVTIGAGLLVLLIAMPLGWLSMLHCGVPAGLNYLGISAGLAVVTVCLLHFLWMGFADPDFEGDRFGEPPLATE